MPSSDLVLRPFEPADAEAIARIYAHYVDNSVCTFDTEVPGAAAMGEKFAAMQAKGHPVFIGTIGGEVVGYAYASDYRPRAGYRFTCEDSVYLAPEYTGKGYGAILLRALIEASRVYGFHTMIAVIAGGIQGSIRLHEKFGFKTLGVFPELGYKFDRWVDIVHMQRQL